MHPLLQNKFVKFAGIGLAALVVLFVVLLFLASISDHRNGGVSYEAGYAPSFNTSPSMGKAVTDEMDMMMRAESSYYPPQPYPDGYTSGLENYETTQYSVSARTKQFDELCDTVSSLKANAQIHFKYLNTSTNNCRATFYVDENLTNTVLNTLTAFSGVEVARNTESVTRHRQQLQGQTDILKQQLASVQSSLTAAETQFDEIAEFARANKDASTLSQAIREKLTLVDTLTQRKINLTSRLDQLYQQSADLEERMNVVQFDVTVSRSYPIYPNQESQKWEMAWEELKDTFTDTLIGLSAFFGIFLLWAVRLAVYLLVLIVVLRGLWKFAKLLMNKW